MALTSSLFFIFLGVTLLVKILFSSKLNLYYLSIIFLSLIFYSQFGEINLGILIASTVLNYLFQTQLSPERNINKKLVLFVIVVFNLSLLVYFKFFTLWSDLFISQNFLIDIFSIDLLMPVGLSFYTFKILSQAIEQYKKYDPVSLIHYSLYVTFFAQILAGPITNSSSFTKILKIGLLPYDIKEVILKFISGLFKKLVLASYLYNFAIEPFQNPSAFSGLDLIFACFVYGVYLYFDFSGYTDIAIAVSNLLGFRATENFAGPYGSKSVGEFWRRWHISLSQWFRDYLYFPLGGDGRNSKNPTLFKYRNFILIMLVSGLWHGSTILFLLWGLMHGIGMVVGDAIAKFTSKTISSDKNYILAPIAWLATFVFINLLWVFFAISSWDNFLVYMTSLSNFEPGLALLSNWRLVTVVFAAVLYNLLYLRIKTNLYRFLDKSNILIFVLFTLICLYLIINLKPELVPPYVYQSF